jgi:hypothetical protein
MHNFRPAGTQQIPVSRGKNSGGGRVERTALPLVPFRPLAFAEPVGGRSERDQDDYEEAAKEPPALSAESSTLSVPPLGLSRKPFIENTLRSGNAGIEPTDGLSSARATSSDCLNLLRGGPRTWMRSLVLSILPRGFNIAKLSAL